MSLPELPLANWNDTKMTLNLYLQIVGKVKLKKMPRRNHWWNLTLFPNSKGITTQTVANGTGSFEIQFNFINHTVEVFTSNGDMEIIPLHDGLAVVDFYKQLLQALKKLQVDVEIVDRPYSIPDENPITTPFDQLTSYASYNQEYVERFWKILLWTSNVFTEFAGRFYNKTCPVQLYWHHMDLAVTRFSGKKLPLAPEMSVQNKDAYSHEVISFGFWAGDDNMPAPAFYSYTHPSPEGLEKMPLQPATASWQMNNGSPMAILKYDDIRNLDDPGKALLDYLESAYMAGAKLNNWDIEAWKVPELETL